MSIWTVHRFNVSLMPVDLSSNYSLILIPHMRRKGRRETHVSSKAHSHSNHTSHNRILSNKEVCKWGHIWCALLPAVVADWCWPFLFTDCTRCICRILAFNRERQQNAVFVRLSSCSFFPNVIFCYDCSTEIQLWPRSLSLGVKKLFFTCMC